MVDEGRIYRLGCIHGNIISGEGSGTGGGGLLVDFVSTPDA